MTTPQELTTPERHWGRITDDAIRAARARIGIPIVPAELHRWQTISTDAIRIWAHALGDPNPLFTKREYAAKTRWGEPIAPGTLLFTSGICDGRPLTAQEREEGQGGAFPGVHGMFSGAEFEWYLPLKDGDELHYVGYLADVQEKQGAFAGREVLQFTERVYRNQRMEVIGRFVQFGMRTERDTAAGMKKYRIEPHQWTADELAEVDATYEAEKPRGAVPRYWEDVEVGEVIPRMVRGPFTGTDAIAFKLGWGEAFTRTGKPAYEYRKRHPQAAPRNKLNIPDVPERVHWEHDFAVEVGVPGFYDYGPQRVSWLGLLMTNWIGDDGWLKKLNVQVRRFNVEGDVQWLQGKVTGKGIDEGEHWVTCEIWAENQRGEVTAPGRATVLLPSREHGPVQLPARGQPPYPTWDGPAGRVTPTFRWRES
jgi:acyl dehydratase